MSTDAPSRIVALGADHAGYLLKDELRQVLALAGFGVLDLGTDSSTSVDYPDFAEAVGDAVVEGRAWRGLIVCGSGAGACIAANKLRGVRAALAHDTYSAHQAVEHDDANVLCLGARIIGSALAAEIVLAWAGAEFSHDERHQRRLDKVLAIEARETSGGPFR
ncbi:MAG: sugar-phosphate isomerase, RpiB/LacA/LacB family [Thermoleophilia bacterium]|nr:sugar-phosphate isomerase, RpiB/LacA/LacB family [Thermoleophilia bacterium]